jgi:tetratricopeptide (TPR) repeat protein
LKIQIFVSLTVLALQGIIYSQDMAVRPSRQAAMESFGRGEYGKALVEFEALLDVYSFALYKYYSGVCLVNLESDPGRAADYLKEAIEDSSGTDIIPDDAWYYLGRANHLAGRFPEAMDSYDQFREKAGHKKAKELNVAGYVRECNERRGSLPGQEIKAAAAVASTPAGKPAGQAVEKQPSLKKEVPAEYDRVLSEAMKYQVKADSLNAVASDFRMQTVVLTPAQQKAVEGRTAEIEALARDYQRIADEKFAQAGIHPVDDVLRDTKQEQSKQEPAAAIVISLFSIETDTEKIRNQVIPVDPQAPAGLVYRIQMGVFSKPVDPAFFRGITPVYMYSVPGTSSMRYFAGMFRRMEDAERSLGTLRQMGFRDSFVTAVLDGKTVSLERAFLMEKEWSGRSLIESETTHVALPDEPATLSFRVEVTRSDEPLKEEIIGNYRTMAGSRGFEIIQADDDTLIYLIGKFITFESAFDYADLLQRNGYSEARVVAYAGSREIPLDTAKKLFEK